MRVIFLDIDGVLNSESYLLKLEAKHHQLGHTAPAGPESASSCDCFKLYQQIDPEAIARLNRLVAVTDARIVVSSTWRKLFDPPELLDLLLGHGLVAEIIGETPDGHAEPEMLDVYGPLERIYRGYEIDFWLRKHPEVDRFVILDDGSDMEMHTKRLVQTDSEEGLLDEHVELAIRVLAWGGETSPSPLEAMQDELEGPKAITSTRSNASVDARRDFDGFAVDEELSRLRCALLAGRWRVVAELAANLDEHLCRGGALPVAWLGPACMQASGDLESRLRLSVEAAARMSQEQRQDAVTGYVAVTPPPVAPPESSWGLHCNEKGCVEMLTLSCTMATAMTDEEAYEQLCPAHATAAVFLGWRTYRCVWWCPTHVVAKNLACARCMSACPSCSCLGGPRGDAVDGIVVAVETTEGETP